MFTYDSNVDKMKDHLRDFLIQIKEFTGDDESDLFLDQREQELRVAEEEKKRQSATVLGSSGTYVNNGHHANNNANDDDMDSFQLVSQY